MASKISIAELRDLDTEIGENWYQHQKKANTADDLLHFPVADGIFDAKFDGLVHAANLSIKHFVKYIQDPDANIDVTDVTKWTGGNPAVRYGRSQADFHWEIDTRMWQYFLLLTAMRRSFRDAIQDSNKITDDDEIDLLQLNNEFWDEVIVQYSYRTEIIERIRGFADHPDKAAGSNRYGYEYEATWDRDDWSEYTLDTLDLNVDEDLIVNDLAERDESSTSDAKHIPDPFPAVEKNAGSGPEKAAKEWINAAKSHGMADEYLRVVMGYGEEKRWIPSRYVGWKISIKNITFPYLKKFTEDSAQNYVEFEEFNTNDPAVRFGLCQAEFQRRLKGTYDQLIVYLETQREGIDYWFETDSGTDISSDDIGLFFDSVYETVETIFNQSIEIDNEDFPDITDVRPVHPRFAPYDPMEPLPWNTDDPEKHERFMEVRGFTI